MWLSGEPDETRMCFRIAVAGWLIQASVAANAATTFSVNSTLDLMDDNTGDGICHTTAGTCTLRAALMQAGQMVVDTVIVLPVGTFLLATTAPAEI